MQITLQPNSVKNHFSASPSSVAKPIDHFAYVTKVKEIFPEMDESSLHKILDFAKSQFARIKADVLYHIPRDSEGFDYSIFLNGGKSHIFIPISGNKIAEGSQNKIKECVRIHINGDKYEVESVTKTVRCLSTNDWNKLSKPDWQAREELHEIHSQNEISILKSLQSEPHVLPLLDHCIYQGRSNHKPMRKMVLFTPRFEADLEEVMTENTLGDLTHDDKIEIVYQIVCGLLSIHREKVAHKDIKTDNILVKRTNEELHVVITDFGHSRYFDMPTTKVDGVGTYLAWPPEFVIQMVDCDFLMLPSVPSVDMWQMGILIHELFYGNTEWDSVIFEMQQQYGRIMRHLSSTDNKDPCYEEKKKILQESRVYLKHRFAEFEKLAKEFENDQDDRTPIMLILRRLLCWDSGKRATVVELKEMLEKEFHCGNKIKTG